MDEHLKEFRGHPHFGKRIVFKQGSLEKRKPLLSKKHPDAPVCYVSAWGGAEQLSVEVSPEASHKKLKAILKQHIETE